MEWCATGRVFGPDEALAGGLVRSVHEPDDLLPAADALAGEIAEHSSAVSVTLTRAMLWRMLGEPHPMAAHRVDSALVDALGPGADVRGRRTELPAEADAVVPEPGPERPPSAVPVVGAAGVLSGRRQRSTARSSWALVIFERPLMFLWRASS